MKKFTFFKITLLAVVLLGSTLPSKSQDAGISAFLNPAPGSIIYPNFPTFLSYTFKNFGSSAITSATIDTLLVEFRVNGGLVVTNDWYPSSTGVPGGGTSTLTEATSVDWSTLGLGGSSSTVSLCAKTRLKKNGLDIDTQTSNDETCITVNYAGNNNPFKYDLAIDSAKIATPHFSQGSNVPNGTFMLKLGFNLRNAGTVDIPAGIPFKVNVKVDGVSYGPFSGTTAGISQNGYVPYTIDAIANSIFLPSDNGAFDICVDLVSSPDDTDNSNDGNCGTYNLVVGVDDVIEEISQFDMFYNEGELRINMFDNAIGTYDLNIISMNGQNVMTQVLNADNSKFFNVSVGDLNTGVYIANVTNANGSIETLRFVVK